MEKKNKILRTFDDSLGAQHTMELDFSVVVTEQYGPSWKVEVFVDNQKSQEFIFSGMVDANAIFALFGCLKEKSDSNKFVVTLPYGVKVKSIHFDLEDNEFTPEKSHNEPKRQSITNIVTEAATRKDNEEEKVDLDETLSLLNDLIPEEQHYRNEQQKEEVEEPQHDEELYLCEPMDEGSISNILTVSFGIHKPEDFSRIKNVVMNVLKYTREHKTNSFTRKEIREYIKAPEGYSHHHKGEYVTRCLQWLIREDLATMEQISPKNFRYFINETFYEIFTKI